MRRICIGTVAAFAPVNLKLGSIGNTGYISFNDNFKCKDGQWIFVAAANDRFWQKLARALDLDDLVTDPRFAVNQQRVKHRAELEALLERVIGERDRESLLTLLAEADVPATPVNTVDQVMNDAQTIERGIIQQVSHPKLGQIPVAGTPLHFSRMAPGVRKAAIEGMEPETRTASHG